MMKSKILILCTALFLMSCGNDQQQKTTAQVEKKVESSVNDFSILKGNFSGPFADTIITVEISQITKDRVYGNSIVAGTERPFAGLASVSGQKVVLDADEPGDNEADGNFHFEMDTTKKDILIGTWKPFKEGMHGGEKKFELKRN